MRGFLPRLPATARAWLGTLREDAREEGMVVRVTEPGRPAFQLRKGEEGISVFDLDAVNPRLTEGEILDSFRPGSQAIVRAVAEIEEKGLQVVPLPGAEPLPRRLREAHAEIRPGPGMPRIQFKQSLKELE